MAESNPEQSGQIDLEHPPERSFWQRPFVQNVLPFATSLLLHAGILILGYATFKAVAEGTRLIKEQIIIPDATLVEGAETGGVPNPGLNADPNMAADVKVEVQEQQQKMERSSISVGAAADTSEAGVIGIGSGTATLRMNGGIAPSAGVASLGVPGGSGGLAPKSPFMGVSGNAYKVCYVCDASGQMVNAQILLKHELKNAISPLKPTQSFNVIFFNEERIEQFKGLLVAATPQNKVEAIKEEGWIDKTYQVQRAANPLPAMQRAFQQQPELIFLLTCGLSNRKDAQVADKLRDEIRKLNPSKKVHVNTILVVPPKDESINASQRAQAEIELKTDIQVLTEIAQENGGKFKQTTLD